MGIFVGIARRWPWILLVASLSLNILLGSYVATLLWRLNMPLIEATNPTRVIGLATAILPDDDARLVEEIYAKRAPAFAAAEAGVLAARRKVLALIAAPELDPAAVRAALEEARSYRRTTSDLLFDVVVETLERMPAEHRRELVERFTKD